MLIGVRVEWQAVNEGSYNVPLVERQRRPLILAVRVGSRPNRRAQPATSGHIVGTSRARMGSASPTPPTAVNDTCTEASSSTHPARRWDYLREWRRLRCMSGMEPNPKSDRGRGGFKGAGLEAPRASSPARMPGRVDVRYACETLRSSRFNCRGSPSPISYQLEGSSWASGEPLLMNI